MISRPNSIEFILEEPTGRARQNWPVTRGVPFPQGVQHNTSDLSLTDASGQGIPIQVKELGQWPDGSLKWILLDFQANLPGMSFSRFHLATGSGVASEPSSQNPLISLEDGLVKVNTGSFQALIDIRKGWRVVDQAWLDGKPMLANPGEGVVIHSAGKEFSTHAGVLTKVEVETSGPLRSVLHIAGDHRSTTGERLFTYETRITAYAGKPWLEFEYTFTNVEDPEIIGLDSIAFELRPILNSPSTGLVGAYDDLYRDEKPFSITIEKPALFNAFSGTLIHDHAWRHVELPKPGEMLKKIAHGWLDLSDAAGGVSVALRRTGQMAPKRLAFSGKSIRVELIPGKRPPLQWHQGWARTHRFLLNFHVGSGESALVNETCTCYEDDLILWAPDWYVNSAAFGHCPAYMPRKYPGINSKLRAQFTSFLWNNRSLGLVDYGDHPQHAGGARANYMSNNEYDLPHTMAHMFARTGERDYAEIMEASAWHMMDIDLVHHSTRNPIEIGGARIHGDNHVQYNCEGAPDFSIAASHMWTEGLLEYHFLSGHPRPLEIAKGIGDCFIRLLDQGWGIPPYKVRWHSSRDSGWPLIALTALFEATGEQKWLDSAQRIATAMLDGQNSDGTWDLRLGWHNGNFTPLQLGIAITGLARFHQVTGDERTRTGMLTAARAFLEKCSFPEGVLWYINTPGYRWNYACGVIIESLGYIWKLTEDIRYLELGLPSFMGVVNGSSPTGTTIGESWRGMLRYMYWADQAGFLTDL